MDVFVETHTLAQNLLVGTVVAYAVLEWAVTYRQRLSEPGGGRLRSAVHSLGEAVFARTAGEDASADRGTKRVLILGMLAALLAGFLAARHVPGADLGGDGWPHVGAGLAIVWAGILLRLWAIAVLGRFFRRVVVVQTGHRVVREGPYRVVRHPAYAGNMLVVLGFGIALGSWLSILLMGAIALAAHVPRIRAEEAALEAALGDEYRSYESETARLVPRVW